MSKHRLLIGAISLLVLFAQRMIRMLDMYFSIVRRRAAWASRESESASLIITTAGQTRYEIQRGIGDISRLRTLKCNKNTFEPLLGIKIDLLGLCDFFE